MNKKSLELLYRSFDEVLTPNEKQRLKDALAKSKELREEKQQIMETRRSISNAAVQSFNPFFAEKVMRRIREGERSSELFFESLLYSFRPVAIAATILLIALMSYNFFKSDQLSIASIFAEPEVSLEQVLEPTLPLAME